MSFETEYFDNYRAHPIKKTKTCFPEDRWAKIKGKWLDPKKGVADKEMTDEEVKQFIQKTMQPLRSQSTYFNEHCAHLDQTFKTRQFIPLKKTLPPCHEPSDPVVETEDEAVSVAPALALKDTEVMKMAEELYEPQTDLPTLEPLSTHFRIQGFMRPCLFKTGLTEYQGGIARLAYTMVRDNRLPRYSKHDGFRLVWGYPPEGVRQPLLDVIPLDGERLY